MRNPWAGLATGLATQSAPRSLAAAKGAAGGFRVVEAAEQCLVLGFNRQLECDTYVGAVIAEMGLSEGASLNKPLLRLFARAYNVHVLLQAAQDALRGRSTGLELQAEAGAWEVHAGPRYQPGQNTTDGVLMVLRDARGRSDMLESLAQTSERYRLAAECGRVGVWEWRLGTGEVVFDPVLLSILGLPNGYRIAQDEICKSILSQEDGEYLRHSLADLVQGREDKMEIDVRARCARGETRILRVNAAVNREASADPECIVGVALDITALREAEFRSRQNEGRLRELFENATDMMYSTDIEGNIRTANKAFQSVTGYSREELLHMNLRDLVFPEDREAIERILLSRLGGDNRPIDEISIRHRDGRNIYLETSNRLLFEDGKPTAIQGIGRNVTERKLLEAQLRQAQKMEAVGTLAGGIAHDFNNLLTGILGFADLLKSRPKDAEKTLEAAEIIQKAAERATRLTSQLIGFARQGKTQNSRVTINSLIDELVDFLSHTLPRSIHIDFDASEEILCVLGDQNQLHQALLNLALNARDAMANGGHMIFRAEKVGRAELQGIDPLASPGEDWVCISVTDTGEGIAQEHLGRIFEPFFTTKPVGKGCGMGLAMVYSIIRNHNGMVDVESQVNSGTTFRILLPLMARETIAPVELVGEDPREGSGLILLVDDEQIVLTVAKMMLSQLGYRVVVAENGERALEIYRSMKSAIDLVFLDVMMPGIDGRECARRLQEEFPGVRILLTSGYLPELAEGPFPRIDGLPVLNKPYQLTDLSQAIERVMSPAPA
ncbi:MAG: PAS domain S-box protein [Bryobacterales bacterium]|nr:PAS domain S-box protein [Bryobacterales bacterium]